MSTAVCTHDHESQEFSVVATPAVSSSQSLAALAAPPAASTATSPDSERSSKQPFVEGLKYGAAGGIAGAFAKSCTAPLARLTILYQVQGFSTAAAGAAGQAGGVAHPPKLRHAFLQVVRREGVAALWKGNLATILHRLPYSSINFYTYENTNRFLLKQLPPNTDFARTLAAGGLAGLVACSVAYPLDLVRTRLAVQTQGNYYHGIVPTLRRILADEGAVGLYRGLGATLLQVVPSLALNFSLYDTIRNSCMAVYNTTSKQQQQTKQQQHHHQQQAAGSLAGLTRRHAAAEQLIKSSRSSSSKGILTSTQDPESLAHSLAVASSVDQGISHSQMLIWHLNDDAASTCSGLRRARAAAAAAEDAYSTSRATSSSSNRSSGSTAAITAEVSGSGSSSSSSSRAAAAGVEVPAGISLASGCISGFLTATVTFPLDVVRRRMQVYGRQHQGQPVGYSQIIRQVRQQGGMKGFYYGILPEYCKVVPGVAIAFCTYEQLKKWLQAE